MRITTDQIDQIGDAAQDLADMAEELAAVRDDEEVDRETKAMALEDFERSLDELIAVLPKNKITPPKKPQ